MKYFHPSSPKPTDFVHCARAMPRAKRGLQKVPIFKEDDRALPL